jgi:hypothetical protein
VEVEQARSYLFSEPGMLGEQVPVTVSNVSLTAANGSVVEYEDLGGSQITFPKGNYTLRYTAPLRNYQLQQIFDRYYAVNVTVPAGYDVRNPLLGGYSQGGKVSVGANGTIEVRWDRTRECRIRFYDPARESLLWFFGTSWAVVAIVLLFPFLMMRFSRRRE